MAKVSGKLAKRCYILVALILVLGFGTDILRLFWIQVIKGDEYKAQAEANQLSDTVLSANRGVIYDANMNVVAASATSWLVYVDPSNIEDDDERRLIADKLGSIIEDADAEKIYKKIGNDKIQYVKIASDIEYPEKEKIVEFAAQNKFTDIIGTTPDSKRYYPFGSFASTIIGSTNDENNGRSGIELQYNDQLTGTPGRLVTAVDARNNYMSNGFETKFDAEQGVSLRLTLDKNIQYYLEKELSTAVEENAALAAYGIVMDVKTGAVLAMSTMPDYDLNDPGVIKDEKTLRELDEIKDKKEYTQAYNDKVYLMWRNKAISDTYEPGSVFKLFTAAAALEEGVINKNFTYTCTGQVKVAENIIHCSNRGGHGTQNLSQGLMNSCNPYFITMGQMLGREKFYKYFQAFGFTEQSGMDLPGEVMPKAGATFFAWEDFGIPQLSSSSFGQTFQVSPIQMVTAVSAIANGGKLMTPYIVGAKLDEKGNVISETTPTVRRQVISESTCDILLDLMEDVVEGGTGKNAYVPGYRVAGKTGTSQKLTISTTKYIASFCGCAPANDPKIAVLIAIDEPSAGAYGGGVIAAPVAGTIIEETLKYMGVEPVYSNDELSSMNSTTPAVTGMSVENAKSTLSGKGFKVRVMGGGDKVVSQYPVADHTIPLNGVVILYTDKESQNKKITVPDFSGMTVSEANETAVETGFNIKISGTSLNSKVYSYKQSLDAGSECDPGSTITVYFKATSGVEDD